MKKQIDLRKRCAESDKICAYRKIGYRPIDDWNELMPVVQKVADDILGLHDGSYCDADTLYEHDFVNLLYKDVPYVRNIVCNTIDWIGKQKRTAVLGTYHNGHDSKIIDKLNEVLHGVSEFTIVEELFVNYFDDGEIDSITEFIKDRLNQNK